MRFASRFGNYSHGVRSAKTELVGHDNRGREIRNVHVPELRAQFLEAPLILTPQEIETAMRSMVHRGLPIDNDTNEHATPRFRISGYDTVIAQQELDWSDEDRELVEKTLLASAHYGSDHIMLEAEKAALPWPSYDTDDPTQIVAIAQKIGLVDEVIAYERENQARKDIILELQLPAPPDSTVVVNAS